MTLELEHGLKEKFEDDRLNKPTSTNFSFKSGKRSHSAPFKPHSRRSLVQT
jgi:hypothetical protein